MVFGISRRGVRCRTDMNNLSLYAALLPVALLASTGGAQNLLTNPGFDAGLAGWSVFGNGFDEATNVPAVVPLSGDRVAKLHRVLTRSSRGKSGQDAQRD